MVPHMEVHTALGRSDLEVDAGDRRWVFEFKYAADGSNVPDLLTRAVEQMRCRHYGITPHGRQLCRLALVFDARTRRFVHHAL